MTRRLKVYAITHDILGDVFWDVFRRGLSDAASRYDMDVEHLRPGRFSPELQARLIESAVEARPDGLISTVPSVDAVEGPLRRAVAAGIPVICVNARDSRPPGERIPYLFYVGGDDGRAGELAARYVLDKATPRAALCVDHYLHDHICHNERWFGFEGICGAAGIPVERLRIPGGDPDACAAAVASRMTANGLIDAVLTLGPPGADAVLAAERLVGVGRTWKHLTFDVAKLQLDGIRSGQIMATIDSQQYLQGYLSVEQMWLHIVQGFTLSSDIYTGPAIVDAANIEAAEEGVRRGIR